MFARRLSIFFQGLQCSVGFSITFWCVCSTMFAAELCKDIQVAIPVIVEWMKNSNQEVSNSVMELFSELVACCTYN